MSRRGAAVLSLALLAPGARAGTPLPDLTALPRTAVPAAPPAPVVLSPRHRRLAHDAAREASLPAPTWVPFPYRLLLPAYRDDYDKDGLSDAAEAALAPLFRPVLAFDSHEESTLPREPVTLFQVRPEGCAGPRSRCGPGPLKLTITYLMLWRDDGGYGPASFCPGDHMGDNQAVRVHLLSVDDGQSFVVSRVDNSLFHWPDRSGSVLFLHGAHPWIFYSAGKHHQFFDTRNDLRGSPYAHGICDENVDGRGPLLLPELSGNVGEPESHPRGFYVGDLGPLGFPGEHAFGLRPFCGGQRCSTGNGTALNDRKWSREPFRVPWLPEEERAPIRSIPTRRPR